MKAIIIRFYFLFCPLIIFGQNNESAVHTYSGSLIENETINDTNRTIITLNKNVNIEIIKDSTQFRFQECPECIRIYINDTTRFPSTIISIDQNGNIISFHQNYQNRINIAYDKKSGKLKKIAYINNKGKYKGIKIK